MELLGNESYEKTQACSELQYWHRPVPIPYLPGIFFLSIFFHENYKNKIKTSKYFNVRTKEYKILKLCFNLQKRFQGDKKKLYY